MKDFDIQMFLTKGKFFNFFKESTIKNVIELLGNTYEIEDYGNGGKYFHYENLRLFFLNDKLSGIDIFLFNSNKTYECLLETNKFEISENTSLLKFIQFLNLLKIKWVIDSENSNLDYLLLRISISAVTIYFYFEEEKIERISLSSYKFN